MNTVVKVLREENSVTLEIIGTVRPIGDLRVHEKSVTKVTPVTHPGVRHRGQETAPKSWDINVEKSPLKTPERKEVQRLLLEEQTLQNKAKNWASCVSFRSGDLNEWRRVV